MRRMLLPGILLAVALALLSVTACTKRTEEDKVRGVIEAVQQATEDRDAKGVLAHLDRSYRDAEGNDIQALKGMLFYSFLRHQKITVIVSNLNVAVEGTSASARFQAILSGRTGASGDILPEAAGVYQFEVSLQKNQHDWLIRSARWEPWGESGQNQGRNAP